ncbi:MAG: sensor histidine kinase [Actinomycetaceae bacterium]|nr:sensor histidine kinase [Actinomycetaceae bacterium]
MKRFVLYAFSRWYHLIVLAACVGLIVFVLKGAGVNQQAITLVALTVCGAWLATLFFGFLHVLPTWKTFDAIIDSAAPLEENQNAGVTATPEQEAGVDACETLTYHARQRLDSVSANALEHREYIESWVHEIKTPIAAAYLALENNQGSATNQIALQLDRISSYVDQALFYARSTSLERDYFISRLALRDVVSAAIRQRRRSLIDVRMSIEISGIDEGVFVRSDEKWLIFMLGQLIDNAVKYRASGDGTQPTLSFSSSYEGEGARRLVVLSVRDNGCGISAADMPRIFDKGFTGSNGRVRDEKATGLGLYLVAKLAQKMGMGVRVNSHENEGAEFSFLFPDPVAL